MTTKAFILIETIPGETKRVVTALAKLEGVKSVDPVTGPYDAIAVVEGANLGAIGNVVTNGIHPITGITRTVTCLALEFNK
jgi:DNA-binding Lrp family transcriptional regulator